MEAVKFEESNNKADLRREEKRSEVKSISMSIEDDLNKLIKRKGGSFDVHEICVRVFRDYDFDEVVLAAKNLIYEHMEYAHQENVLNANHHSAAGAIVIAEACNLAAKSLNYNFYKLKPILIICAYMMGAVIGVDDDGIYYLYDRDVGVACFHDLDGEIEELWKYFIMSEIPKWKYKWSGITRQEVAFNIAHDYVDRDNFLPYMAKNTKPKEIITPVITYDNSEFDSHFIQNEEAHRKQINSIFNKKEHEDTEILREANARSLEEISVYENSRQ